MREVSDAAAGLVDQLADSRHLFEIDLFDRVGHAVIVGMQKGCKEDDGDTLRRIAVMIAPVINPFGIGRIVQRVIEPERLRQSRVRIDHDVMQFGADAVGTDRVYRIGFRCLVVVITSDHVHIELRHNLVERHCRIIREVSGTVESSFFAGMPNEQKRTLRLWSEREGARNADQCCGSRSIIIGAVRNAICRAFRKNALYVPNVVVVRAESDVGVLQLRVGAVNDADNVARVLGVDHLIIGIEVEGQSNAFQREPGQILLLLTHRFEIGVLDLRSAEKEFEKLIGGGDGWRPG